MNGKSRPVLLRRSVDLFCVGASQVSSLLLDLNWLCSLKVSRYSEEPSQVAWGTPHNDRFSNYCPKIRLMIINNCERSGNLKRNFSWLQISQKANNFLERCLPQPLNWAHWSKLTLIPFLIWRTFDHSRRWEMIKEFQIQAKN